MFICTSELHCTWIACCSWLHAVPELPVNTQIIYATSLWKMRLWSNGFLSVRLQNYKCKVILVRYHQPVLWNFTSSHQHACLSHRMPVPNHHHPPKETSGFHSRDSLFNVKAGLSTARTHWAGAPQEGQQIATHRNQDHHVVKIQAESRGSGKGQGGLEHRRKERLLLYLSIQQVRTVPVHFSRMSKWTLGQLPASLSHPLSVTSIPGQYLCQREKMNWTYLLQLRNSHDSGLEMIGDMFTNVNKIMVQ